MANEQPQAPTEEQLATAKASADAELAKWEGDFSEEELVVPYKREADEKDDKDTKEEKTDDVDTKTEEDTAGSSDKSKEEPVEQLSEPEPLVTVQDPGEYKPADYSFEVTLADGKTVTIKTMEQAEELAEDPENFETPKQLLDFIRKSQKMETKLEKDREKWEADKAKFDEQTEAENERQQNIDNIAKEIQYLVSEGLLPEVAEEYRNADWMNPEVAKQPGVREQKALLDYMVKENTKRAKAGIAPLNSMLDAYNGWSRTEEQRKAEEDRKVAEAEKKQQGEARRAAGARVASTSPSNQGAYVPKGIAVGNPNVLRRGAAMWED